MEQTKIEFLVQLKDEKCIEDIKVKLQGVAEDIEFDLKSKKLIVKSSLPWHELQKRIEKEDRKIVLAGYGRRSAVSTVYNPSLEKVHGVVRFSNSEDISGRCVVDGTLDGLPPGNTAAVEIRECGDLSAGCANVGEVYGDLGEIIADQSGRAVLRTSASFDVQNLIGRSVVVRSHGQTTLACGIIARSAGILENYKKVCACDGVTLWDERDVPLAGKARQQHGV